MLFRVVAKKLWIVAEVLVRWLKDDISFSVLCITLNVGLLSFLSINWQGKKQKEVIIEISTH